MKVRTGLQAGQQADSAPDCAELLDQCQRQLQASLPLAEYFVTRTKHDTAKSSLSNIR
jgi:hypothetical protein